MRTEQILRLNAQHLRPDTCLVRHYAHFFFHLRRVDHDDGVPRAAVEERAVRTLARALLTSDAEDGIDLNAAEWWVIFVGNPEHAVFHRTVLHAGWRARTAGAALGNNG